MQPTSKIAMAKMTAKREYSILPQGEKDDFHHHVRDGRRPVTSHYLCMFSMVTLLILIILAGVASLTASVFYPDKFSATFRHFWYSYDATILNGTNVDTNRTDESSITSSWFSVTDGSQKEGASGDHHKSSDYLSDHDNKSESNYHHHHHRVHHHHTDNEDQYSNDTSSGNYTAGENDLYFHSNITGNGSDNGTDSGETMDNNEKVIINVEQLKEKFAEAMRDFEKHMENFTGIRKAEFVVPIFMLISFLMLFSMVSLCCCIMVRRRDNRRRKLFGKLITDLQTGDSKTVLLNHSDLDD